MTKGERMSAETKSGTPWSWRLGLWLTVAVLSFLANVLSHRIGYRGQAILGFSGGSFRCAALGPRRSLTAGDSRGCLYILRLTGVDFGAPRVTAAYLYRFDRKQYDEQPSVKCESCGQRFPAPPVVLDTILDIVPHRLPDEAYDEPGLLSECPHCREPLRFNPFIVDNRGIAQSSRSNKRGARSPSSGLEPASTVANTALTRVALLLGAILSIFPGVKVGSLLSSLAGKLGFPGLSPTAFVLGFSAVIAAACFLFMIVVKAAERARGSLARHR